MDRPESHRWSRWITQATRTFAVGSVVYCLLAGIGCAWLRHQQGRESEICRECMENSFRAQQAGDLRQAREYLADGAAQQPRHAEIWWNLAELSIQQDDYASAIRELTKYIELQPNDPQGHLRLAQLYYLQSQYKQADDALQPAIRLTPNNFEAILLSARLARKQAGHQQATAAYYHALQVNPGHVEATLELSELLISRMEANRAAGLLREMSRRNLEDEDMSRVHLNLGIAYGQTNRWENAVEQLILARSLAPSQDARDRYRLAYAHWKAGDTQQSLELLIELADAGQWNQRSDALYTKITQDSLAGEFNPTLQVVNYQSLAPFLPDRLLPSDAVNPQVLIPPEWAMTE